MTHTECLPHNLTPNCPAYKPVMAYNRMVRAGKPKGNDTLANKIIQQRAWYSKCDQALTSVKEALGV